MRWHRTALKVVLGLSLAVAVAAPVAASSVKLRIALSPAPMNFGAVAVGEQSAAQVLYATNRSPVPLRWVRSVFSARPAAGTIVLNVAAYPAYCFNGTDWIIEPGQTCALVSIAFKPDSKGAFYIDGVNTFTDGMSTITVTSTAKGKGV